MKKSASIICATLAAIVLGGCAATATQSEWITLLDTSGRPDNFTPVGDAKWVVTEQGVEAQQKRQQYAFLMSKDVYEDFVLLTEFWVSDDANSGVFLRCQNPQNPTATTCYEVNIFDQRPNQTYATGGIVNVAPAPTPVPQAGGRWNIYEIKFQGPQLTVSLNGEIAVDVEDSRFKKGYIGLQWGEGIVRFRVVRIKPL